MDIGGRIRISSNGYVYTLLTSVMAVAVLSIVFFYMQVYESEGSNDLNRIEIMELQEHVEFIKSDYQRALGITVQRALLYTVNNILSNEDYVSPDYVMHNCTGFNYTYRGEEPAYNVAGAESAVAELMVCATFEGKSGDAIAYMENHTIPDWINRIEQRSKELGFQVDMEFLDLELSMYDESNILAVTRFNIEAKDRLSGSYHMQNILVSVIVPIEGVEDPQYVLRSSKSISRPILMCERREATTPELLAEWIESGCYLKSARIPRGPSFFSRLEGLSYSSPRYQLQAELQAEKLGLAKNQIGLASFIDFQEYLLFGLPTTNASRMDYMYWQDKTAECRIGGVGGREVMADLNHVFEYGVRSVNVTYIVSSDEGGGLYTQFISNDLNVPRGVDLEFTNNASKAIRVRATKPGWESGVYVNPGFREWFRNINAETGFRIEDIPTPPDENPKSIEFTVSVSSYPAQTY
ncbi:MAG TPA: hypothetical protein ENN13_02865 [Candidatus Altiarchaeales archaeon]|nr:hypothetical protein [Candidatus Altiarchaeales archaeon]